MSCSVAQQPALNGPLSPTTTGITGNSRMVTMERRRSVKPFRTQDEYLYAMKEDLSEWINSLYGLSTTAEDLLDHLETGSLLCRHAEQVQQYVISSFRCAADDETHFSQHHHQAAVSTSRPTSAECQYDKDDHHLNPGCGTGIASSKHLCAINGVASSLKGNNRQHTDSVVNCGSSVLTERMQWASVLSAAARSTAQPGSFHSRDNLCQFLAWCRRQLFIPDTLLFETDDLVLRKNERSVVLCLLEAARRAVRSYGFPSAPDLVRLEQEIDEELAREAAPMTSAATQAPARRRPVIEVDMMSLDEMVRDILGRCTCPDQFPMVRVSEGRYRIGDSLTMIFVRILRSHVMVRIGGGWDTLENFLDRHDPCRCQSRGHRVATTSSTFSGSTTLSTSRSFEKTVSSPTSGDSRLADIQDRRVMNSSSPSSTAVTSVQTSGAWSPSAKSGTSRSEKTVDGSQSLQQTSSRPKTPSRECDQKLQSSRTTPTFSGRRTPVAMATIDIDNAANDSLNRVAMTTTPPSSTPRSRPKTPVNVTPTSTSATTNRATRRDAFITSSSARRRPTTPDVPDSGTSTNAATGTSGNHRSTRSRSVTRTPMTESASSEPSARSRRTPRSLSVDRQEAISLTAAEGRQRHGPPAAITPLRRSGTSGDIRRDVIKAEEDSGRNPRMLMISRNTIGRHSVDLSAGSERMKTKGEGATPRRDEQKQQKSGSTSQMSRQLPATATPTTRSQTTVATGHTRLSMTADKLLPSKLRVQQQQQQQQQQQLQHLPVNDSSSGTGAFSSNASDTVVKRLSLDCSGHQSSASVTHGLVRRTASVGDSIAQCEEFDDAIGITHTVGQQERDDRNESSRCRISVIKKSPSETASMTSAEAEHNDDLRVGKRDSELVRLDDVSNVDDNTTSIRPDSAKTGQRDDGRLLTERGSVKVETAQSSATTASDANTGSCAAATTAKLAADAVCPAADVSDSGSRPSGEVSLTSARGRESFKTLIDSMADIPPPDDDEDINSRMEMLFEEYRKVEMGLMDLVWKANNDVDSVMHKGGVQFGGACNQSDKRQPTSKGRETSRADRTLNASVRQPATDRNTSGLTKSGFRRSWSGSGVGIDQSTPANPRTSREPAHPTSRSGSSPMSTSATSAAVRKNLASSVSASPRSSNTPTTSLSMTNGALSTRKTERSERPGRSTTAHVASENSSSSNGERRRARSCVRSDERSDIKRSNSTTFGGLWSPDDCGKLQDTLSNVVDSPSSQQRTASHEPESSLSSRSSNQQQQQQQQQTLPATTASLDAAMSWTRYRRRSCSKSTSHDSTPTRIPMPVFVKRPQSEMTSPESCDERLKRVDSGVDINNAT